MPSILITETPGRLVIRQRSDFAARLFGLPFLAVGAYFLYQLLGTLGDYRNHGISTAALDYLPGTLLLALMLLSFAVPGILLVFFAKEVALDLQTHQVTETLDLLLYKKRTNHSLSSFTKVIAREERTETRRKHGLTPRVSYVYAVVMATTTDTEVAVTASSVEEEAEHFALKLSRFISKPYENHMNE